MVWESSCLKFARPIRTIVAMYGDKIIKFSLANGAIKSSNKTIGLHTLTTKPIIIKSADVYKETLQNNCVLIDQQERKERIISSINEVANSISAKAILDENLVNEVNQLVEYPTAVLCKFNEKYLKLPPEVLITCLKKQQKCFAVKDSMGKLTNYFINVRNGKSDNLDIVRAGYEKVVVARLEDSVFFYDNDIKKPFEQSIERLKGLIFQKEIGTVYEKLTRIKTVANFINEENKLNINKDNLINKNNKEKELKEKSDALFEECWIAYNRKGSKKKSKQYWDKLSSDELKQIMPHIKAYTQGRERQYQKDFDRYLRDKTFNDVVIKGNVVVFDPTIGTTQEYHPATDGNIRWLPDSNCYKLIGMYWGEIWDGYTDENRPNGAQIMLSNGQGMITWNSENKKWEHE